MVLYDLTVPLRTGIVTFPGDPPFSMSPYFERKKGDPFDLSLLSMGTHIGTHVDPPGNVNRKLTICDNRILTTPERV